MIALLVGLALAEPTIDAPAAATVVTPAAFEQRVTVYLRGLPSGIRASVARADGAPVAMADPGLGVLAADLTGPSARFLPLRISARDGNGSEWLLYDGLVVLSDGRHETIAFQYQDRQLLRLPLSPSARTELALDQRATWWVGFGVAAISLGWLGVVGVVWAVRSR